MIQMHYKDFLDRVIDEGIEAAGKSYVKDPAKFRGARAGFEACRDQMPHQLVETLKNARLATCSAFADEADDYWEIRCYEAEVEWVCNVVSAALMNHGLFPIATVTARGVVTAARILGFGSDDNK